MRRNYLSQTSLPSDVITMHDFDRLDRSIKRNFWLEVIFYLLTSIFMAKFVSKAADEVIDEAAQ